MLKISLIVVGEKMPQWVVQGYRAYAKRIRGRVQLNLIEVPAIRRGKNADLGSIVRLEERKILDRLPKKARVIALDRGGKSYSTMAFSEKMKRWLERGEPVALVVGGPEGLSAGFINNADESWSLSALTLAHPLVRVVVAEQLYRCFSILEGIPYHR
ncbi:23S rRNA (pseudouridine(1915)-N(3))-methyltransferase RlmH [Candidatus Spongiihabitans sp.]|uniref:23S rRNA (pseudouridine(1915)-N(3))-methyltransferase RlmH n=1 Tax=Candidatus Spongiihabitans sp. TaxID=3101308 RepID=UPI003C7D54F3